MGHSPRGLTKTEQMLTTSFSMVPNKASQVVGNRMFKEMVMPDIINTEDIIKVDIMLSVTQRGSLFTPLQFITYNGPVQVVAQPNLFPHLPGVEHRQW